MAGLGNSHGRHAAEVVPLLHGPQGIFWVGQDDFGTAKTLTVQIDVKVGRGHAQQCLEIMANPK